MTPELRSQQALIMPSASHRQASKEMSPCTQSYSTLLPTTTNESGRSASRWKT